MRRIAKASALSAAVAATVLATSNTAIATTPVVDAANYSFGHGNWVSQYAGGAQGPIESAGSNSVALDFNSVWYQQMDSNHQFTIADPNPMCRYYSQSQEDYWGWWATTLSFDYSIDSLDPEARPAPSGQPSLTLTVKVVDVTNPSKSTSYYYDNTGALNSWTSQKIDLTGDGSMANDAVKVELQVQSSSAQYYAQVRNVQFAIQEKVASYPDPNNCGTWIPTSGHFI